MSLSGIGDRSLLFLLLLLNKQILVGDTKITLFILHSYFGLFLSKLNYYQQIVKIRI